MQVRTTIAVSTLPRQAHATSRCVSNVSTSAKTLLGCVQEGQMLVRRARTRSSWLRYAHLNLSPCYCLQLSPATLMQRA